MLFHTKVFETRDERLFDEICKKLDQYHFDYKVRTVDTNNQPYDGLKPRQTLPLEHRGRNPVINDYVIYVRKEFEKSAQKIIRS